MSKWRRCPTCRRPVKLLGYASHRDKHERDLLRLLETVTVVVQWYDQDMLRTSGAMLREMNLIAGCGRLWTERTRVLEVKL